MKPIEDYSIEQLEAEIDRRKMALITPAEIESFFDTHRQQKTTLSTGPYTINGSTNPVSINWYFERATLIKKLAILGWKQLQPKTVKETKDTPDIHHKD